jgi:hypothetical protein
VTVTNGVRVRVQTPAEIGEPLRTRMFDLMADHFLDAGRPMFDADLDEKDEVLLVEVEEGDLAGFTTFGYREMDTEAGSLLVVYSGDTILRRQDRDRSDLHAHWARHVFQLVDRSTVPVWWLLICSGYKTFRYMPAFFRDYYPPVHAAGTHGDASMKRLRDTIASQWFGDRYDPERGVVSVPGASTLRPGVADIDERRLADPRVAEFVRLNPGHAAGDELACVCRLARDNLTAAGRRAVGDGTRQ